TRDGIARWLNVPLEENADAMAQIEGFFSRWQRPMPESNRRQGMIPRGGQVLANPRGTAPGFRIERNGLQVIALPGVPAEMKPMFRDHVEPLLQSSDLYRRILTARLNCFGIREARLGELLAD